jgi:hypothetical protein
MRQPLAEMSPRTGVSQVPRLRAETHFGVQARALPVGLDKTQVFVELTTNNDYL